MKIDKDQKTKRGPKVFTGATFLMSFGKGDKDIYKHLQNQRHKSEYIRDLIAADIKKRGGK